MTKQIGTLVIAMSVLSSCSGFFADTSASSSVASAPTLSFSLVDTSGVMKSLNPVVHVEGAVAGAVVTVYSDTTCSVALSSSQTMTGSSSDFSLSVPYGTINLYYQVTSSGLSSGCVASTLNYQANYATGNGFPLGKLDQIIGEPNSVYIDRAGNFYVADQNQKPLKKYNSAGVLQWQTSSNNGSADGQFGYTPGAIIGDSQGNIYVVDGFNKRVQKFSSDGIFLSKFGSSGTSDGQFTQMSGMAIDSADNLYITDSSTNYIQKFAADGTFLTKFGGPGTGPGQFSFASNITIDTLGNIYVTDMVSPGMRIEKFDSNGVYVSDFSSQGSADGQYQYAGSMFADRLGHVFMADGIGTVISKFDAATGAFISKVDIGLNNQAIAIDPISGDIVAWTSYLSAIVRRFGADGVLKTTYGSQGTNNGSFNNPMGIRTDSAGNIYVSDYANYKIQKFNSSGVFQAQFGAGAYGTTDGYLKGTYTVAIDSHGNVFIPDTGRMQKFDPSGTFVSKFGVAGTADGEFKSVTGLAIDASDNIYISDYQNTRIEKFDASGAFLLKFGSSGTGDGQFSTYLGKLLVDASGNIYVVDGYNYRVQKFSPTGVFLLKFGAGGGSADGQFGSPNFGIALDSHGDLWTVDPNQNRVQKFDGTTGAFIAKYGTVGEDIGQLYNPTDIAIDSSDHIFITEGTVNFAYRGGHNRVQKFDLNMQPLVR